MSYVDGYVLAIPKKHLKTYKRMAVMGKKAWMKHGAVDYKECAGDDLGAKLSPVLQKALAPGARVVSHRFTLGDWKPKETKEGKGDDGDSYTLHLWVVPERKK